MAPLMPSLAKSTNVYCPLEGTHGAVSAMLSQKPETKLTNHTGPPESNHWAAGSSGPTGDKESPQSSPSPPPSSSPSSPSQASPLIASSSCTAANSSSCAANSISVPCTSTQTTTGTTSATSISTASKCKQSTLHASQSNDSDNRLQQAVLLPWMVSRNLLMLLTPSLDAVFSCNQNVHVQIPHLSVEQRPWIFFRKRRTILNLDDDHMVAFIDLFWVDTASADAYLVIKRESLRRKWVEKQLVEALGFPPL